LLYLVSYTPSSDNRWSIEELGETNSSISLGTVINSVNSLGGTDSLVVYIKSEDVNQSVLIIGKSVINGYLQGWLACKEKYSSIINKYVKEL
jgi:hypothetical protein